MTAIFSLIGDSNVRRHLNPQNSHDRPQMVGAEVKTCGRIEVLSEVLRSVRSQSSVVLLSCVTNFLTSIDGVSTNAGIHVQPTLIELREVMLDFCSEQPDRWVFFFTSMDLELNWLVFKNHVSYQPSKNLISVSQIAHGLCLISSTKLCVLLRLVRKIEWHFD